MHYCNQSMTMVTYKSNPHPYICINKGFCSETAYKSPQSLAPHWLLNTGLLQTASYKSATINTCIITYKCIFKIFKLSSCNIVVQTVNGIKDMLYH